MLDPTQSVLGIAINTVSLLVNADVAASYLPGDLSVPLVPLLTWVCSATFTVQMFAMVVDRDKVAAIWEARDPGGTIYLYVEHVSLNPEPSENTRAIQGGDSMSGRDPCPEYLH